MPKKVISKKVTTKKVVKPAAKKTVARSLAQPVMTKTEVVTKKDNYSDKNVLVALLLCFFVGLFGIHRFYAGKIGTGIAMILTFGGFGLWTLVDLVLIALGEFSDMSGKKLKWSSLQNREW
jgi:TM2 domain